MAALLQYPLVHRFHISIRVFRSLYVSNNRVPTNDDGSSMQVPVSTSFPYFNQYYLDLFTLVTIDYLLTTMAALYKYPLSTSFPYFNQVFRSLYVSNNRVPTNDDGSSPHNNEVPTTDDGSSPQVPVGTSFPYFNQVFRSLYVSNNRVPTNDDGSSPQYPLVHRFHISIKYFRSLYVSNNELPTNDDGSLQVPAGTSFPYFNQSFRRVTLYRYPLSTSFPYFNQVFDLFT
ncbi:TECTA [Mytilus edulis]|uniref:TECTA n=1 Tax=Mytilus edulis TaxID=6550 RepID=A0A8S3V3Y6_MYTED|nr:TECTA [Mytilus edulis]